MSLVQEALKRKAEEQQTPRPPESDIPAQQPPSNDMNTTPVPPVPPPPSAPSDNPAPEGKEPDPKSGTGNALKSLLVWLLVLFVLIGLTIGAYIAYSRGLFSKKTDAAPDAAEAAAEPTAAPTSETAGEQPPAQEPLLTADSKEPERKHSTAYTLINKTREITAEERKTSTEAAALMEQPPAASAAPTPTAIPTPPPRKTAPAAARDRPAAAVPAATALPTVGKKAPTTPSASRTEDQPNLTAQDAPIAWPKIKLTGVMASKNKSSEGLAFIDGQVIACGQRVQGIKLISVHADGVVLEFQGDIRTLRVGGEMF